MLDLETRTAVLRLHREGHGARRIARALGISRNAVRAVLRSGVVEVPPLERSEKLDGHIDRVRELHAACRGNLARVHEELHARGVEIAYATLTSFCRRQGIGKKPRQPAGRYHFEPGQEMQHDTSPHRVTVGGKQRLVQCASLVLCHSRMLFAQVYPTFNRFWCKVFLTDALCYFGGAAGRCMVDNTSVIVGHGRGAEMVPAPEMAAFSRRFGFELRAHEVGDANRSAHVERQFDHIERNFYPGRVFADLADCNQQLRAWCEQKNASFKRHLHARPVELFAAEKLALRPLPLYVPEVYEPVDRIVDVEGYVTAHTNRYSLPAELLGRRVCVHLAKDRVRIFEGHRMLCEHPRAEDGAHARSTLDQHKQQRRWNRHHDLPSLPEEPVLRAVAPELSVLLDALRKRHGGRAPRHIRRLHRLYLDYPTEPLVRAVARALDHGLTDLCRIETIVLRNVAGDFFRLPDSTPQAPDDEPRDWSTHE